MKKGIIFSIIGSLSLLALPSTGDAYVLNSKKIYDTKDAYYWIDPAFTDSQEKNIGSGINTWDVTPEVEFTKKASTPAGANLKIEHSNTSKGTVVGTSFGKGHIILWSGWKKLGSSDKKETVVHEVGHELGLAHTQQEKNSISVMRAKGFNGKPYPLSDDKAGISAKY
ncbi:hypothetical protein K7T73_21820 (plasmid) [Bacillus badius]|uniref:M12 family metallopeptidase n=1 Tax=Bacillus badius TaxID=1455 RepID=UPI001CBB514E|nr:M12 family metallopeptidase [Bacillus badius]UAT33112.1 hypothetical protein K7T73_21820 [Bacillus badius]